MPRTYLAGIAALSAIATLVPLRAEQTVGHTVEYVMIAQRPDEAGAVHAPYSASFAACCSAFSASTTAEQFPTPAVEWVQVMVHMTATTALDAVRVRAFRWVQTNGVWSTVNEYFPEQSPQYWAPTILNAPRTVGGFLSTGWWQSRPAGETAFALEVRGAPVIYGAKLRVRYVGGL